MPHVVLYMAASLDGFIADRDGGVHWLTPFDSPGYGYDEFLAGMGTLVMGRATYDQTLTFGDWPYADKRVVVMTRHPLPTPPPGVRELLAALDGDIWLVGGAQTAHSFLDHGLVDRLRLFVIPVLLGEGIRLFPGSRSSTVLQLIECRRFATGVVELEYGRA